MPFHLLTHGTRGSCGSLPGHTMTVPGASDTVKLSRPWHAAMRSAMWGSPGGPTSRPVCSLSYFSGKRIYPSQPASNYRLRAGFAPTSVGAHVVW